MKKKSLSTQDLINKIEKITRERIAKEKVVNLKDFREMKVKEEQVTLLVIEDDETMRAALKRIFEAEGYRVVTAADGTQLSDILDQYALDMIILDIGLPWINGFELAELMKEHIDLKQIPLIFISGRTSDEDVKKGFEVGADDYIKKPFDVEKIKKTVNALMKLAHD